MLEITGGRLRTEPGSAPEDLRGGAALVAAGLAAEGSTEIAAAGPIFDRGYEQLEKRHYSAGR